MKYFKFHLPTSKLIWNMWARIVSQLVKNSKISLSLNEVKLVWYLYKLRSKKVCLKLKYMTSSIMDPT